MKTILLATLLSSATVTFAAADPFYEPRGLSAGANAKIQRVIAEAYATNQQTYGRVNVHEGAGGTTVCNQGVVDNSQAAPNHRAFGETNVVVVDSVNVCFGK